MDRKTYYVTVQHAEIMEDSTAFNFDFVIQANDDEVDELQELFENVEDADNSNKHSAYVPYDDHGDKNRAYDDNLREVYKKIHQLGSPETKEHIEKMNILH
jgi:hypothetical protein